MSERANVANEGKTRDRGSVKYAGAVKKEKRDGERAEAAPVAQPHLISHAAGRGLAWRRVCRPANLVRANCTGQATPELGRAL